MTEWDSTATWTDYIYAEGQKIAKITSAGTLNYYLDDHLGTTQVELDASGNVTWSGQFTPFGAELDAGGTTMHYKFTGKERDSESGLDFFGARYYASTVGRWMSPDWALKPEDVPYATMADPQSLNLYGYVGNNPLSKADADGHWGDYYRSNDGAYLGSDGIHDGSVSILPANGNVTKYADGTINLSETSIPIARFSPAEGKAVLDSVSRTLSHASGDSQGGFHEEGFKEDATGIQNGPSGPLFRPGDSEATYNGNGALSPTTTVEEHTHPLGTATTSGGFTIGGTQFQATPSGKDISGAGATDTARGMYGGSPVTHVESSAATQKTYVYNGYGVQGQVPTSAFDKAQKDQQE